MNYENYFPKGTASGAAFCNRVEERTTLIKKITTGQHVLIMSPRRYGKTSLVRRSIIESKLPYGEIDLFVAVDAKRIEHQVLSGIQEIIRKVTTSVEQAIEIVSNVLRTMRLKWVVGIKGLNIALIPDSDTDPAENIQLSLQALENILTKKKQKAILFIDEVQEIGEIAEGKGIEGAIRHVAQSSKYLSVVFSGSKRHLLRKMFLDSSRPLFKLCSRINLERIHKNDYVSHINKFAKKTWGVKISKKSFEKIFELTECHPYYINSLCLQVWEEEKSKPPTVSDINRCWHKMLIADRQEILEEFSNLTISQRKLIVAVANGENEKLTGHQFLTNIGLSSSTVNDSLNALELKDYLNKSEDGRYHIIDPLIKTAAQHFFT